MIVLPVLTLTISLLSAKTSVPKETTVSGITRSLTPEPKKSLLLSAVRPLPIAIVSADKQPSNADTPTEVTDSGILISSNEAQL